MILSPVSCMVRCTVSAILSSCRLSSCLKLTRNLMVTSMVIPRATLNTRTVEGFMRMFIHPIMPAVISSGTTFTTMDINSIRQDLNNTIIHPKMIRNASIRLSLRLFTINLLPSKKVILVPVNVIWYLLVSKIL